MGGLGDPDKDTVVDLEESEELEDLSGLGGDLGDTLDPDDEVDLGLGGDVEVTGLSGLSLEPDLFPLLVSVLLDVLVSTLEDDLSLSLTLLCVQHAKGLSVNPVSKFAHAHHKLEQRTT